MSPFFLLNSFTPEVQYSIYVHVYAFKHLRFPLKPLSLSLSLSIYLSIYNSLSFSFSSFSPSLSLSLSLSLSPTLPISFINPSHLISISSFFRSFALSFFFLLSNLLCSFYSFFSFFIYTPTNSSLHLPLLLVYFCFLALFSFTTFHPVSFSLGAYRNDMGCKLVSQNERSLPQRVQFSRVTGYHEPIQH
ncbi:unnamed protein product [Acanthosepion pharaonis]|uniref:Uncharacterized protein n=1 Tax=Acanthosepion pharaonis TaxID=158019 RepID=A0A812AUG5_ACAPH|nr:unnamed protein product [Sepia pharaonis]